MKIMSKESLVVSEDSALVKIKRTKTVENLLDLEEEEAALLGVEEKTILMVVSMVSAVEEEEEVVSASMEKTEVDS